MTGRLAAAALAIGLLAPAAAGVEVRKVRPPAPDDEALARAIVQRIGGRPSLDVSRVTVAAASGEVVLSGVVATLFQRAEIERFASQVRGAASVDNRIDVERLRGPEGTAADALLAQDAERALLAEPRLRALGIKATISRAEATLEGEAPVALDREEAEEVISKIPGVVAIRNRIRLAAPPVDPALIRRRIETRLRDRLVFGGAEGLAVQVEEGGAVRLEGVTATHADRLRAERLAYGVRGVSTVDNRLVVGRVSERAR